MVFLSLTLRELYLSWNMITAQGFVDLLKYATDNERLKVLDMSHNRLSQHFQRNHVSYLSHFLEQNTGMVHLDLSHNNLPEFALEPVTLSLDKNHTLLGIHLEGNFGGVEIDLLGHLKAKTNQIDLNSINRPPINGVFS
jgi:hypothetical protein